MIDQAVWSLLRRWNTDVRSGASDSLLCNRNKTRKSGRWNILFRVKNVPLWFAYQIGLNIKNKWSGLYVGEFKLIASVIAWNMEKLGILWADDEIDLLEATGFLSQEKDAIHHGLQWTWSGSIPLQKILPWPGFLDESMPGLPNWKRWADQMGLDHASIMVTKMKQKIWWKRPSVSQISDYLIKPD